MVALRLARLALEDLLPTSPECVGGTNHQGLRLFAVACARRVESLLTDPWARSAIDVAEAYAKGVGLWAGVCFAYARANTIKVPATYRQPHHWATIAATACALAECQAGPFNSGRGPEWGAIAAARIASCAANLAEQGAYFRTHEQIQEAQIGLLRQYVPEIFAEVD